MKRIRNKVVFSRSSANHVVLHSTVYTYFAAPIFVVLSLLASPWWLLGTAFCFWAGWMTGRERWRRVLAGIFIASLFWSPAVVVAAWLIGYVFTGCTDAHRIHMLFEESLYPPDEEEDEP